ncbi:ATP-binding protein [Streptomyces sp. B6B3]|uniref:ATP-binding protein n=1 Tax=Streptomyces sp. B6B3 TaxID=3153570 RepID=UPI00325C8825
MCSTRSAYAAPPSLTDFSFTFPPEPQWVRSAREAVRAALAPTAPGGADLVEIATLLTSELVTNAFVASVHSVAPAPIALHAEWTRRGAVRVLVHDRAPGTPLVPDHLPDADDEGGRGLLLLTLHATEWGVCHHAPGPGKLVWFTLGDKP